MCSYTTVGTAVAGSAKGPNGSWFHVTDATVYFDHPVHALAVELDAASARALVAAIQQALDSAPAELTA
jgi:hypothetical protein